MRYSILADKDCLVWFKNYKFHRLYGPAREHNDGYKSWWIDGVFYTEEEFLKF